MLEVDLLHIAMRTTSLCFEPRSLLFDSDSDSAKVFNVVFRASSIVLLVPSEWSTFMGIRTWTWYCKWRIMAWLWCTGLYRSWDTYTFYIASKWQSSAYYSTPQKSTYKRNLHSIMIMTSSWESRPYRSTRYNFMKHVFGNTIQTVP